MNPAGSNAGLSQDRELDRALGLVTAPPVPAGLAERILATVPHLPQLEPDPATATLVTGRSGWRLAVPASLGALAAGIAAIALFGAPTQGPARNDLARAAASAAAVVVINAPPAPALARIDAPQPVHARHGAVRHKALPADNSAGVDEPAAALPEVAGPLPVAPAPVLAAANPRGPKLGPPAPNDGGDGAISGTSPLAPAPKTGFGFRGAPGN